MRFYAACRCRAGIQAPVKPKGRTGFHGVSPNVTSTPLNGIFDKLSENGLVRLNPRNSTGRAVAVQEGRGRLNFLRLSEGWFFRYGGPSFCHLAVLSQIRHTGSCRIKGVENVSIDSNPVIYAITGPTEWLQGFRSFSGTDMSHITFNPRRRT